MWVLCPLQACTLRIEQSGNRTPSGSSGQTSSFEEAPAVLGAPAAVPSPTCVEGPATTVALAAAPSSTCVEGPATTVLDRGTSGEVCREKSAVTASSTRSSANAPP